MTANDAIPELIRMLYDAVGDRKRWIASLQRMGQIFQSPVNVLYPQNLKTDAVNLHCSATSGYDPSFLQSYAAYYAAKNPFFKCSDIARQAGRVVRTQEYVSTTELVGSEFYNDWMQPQKVWHGLQGIVHQQGSTVVTLGLVRHRNQPLFEEADERLLNQVTPHLRRAIQLHSRIDALRLTNQAALALLDQWSMGVFLVGENGQVLLMNSAAEKATAKRDGLIYENGHLRASRRRESDALRRLIATAVRAGRGELVHPGGSVNLTRLSLKQPWRLLVTPIRVVDGLFLETRPSAAIFVGNTEDGNPNPETLREIYRLTAAEAKVAALLMKGQSVKQAAEELRISMSTVRTHLARLLHKTGTRRQAELVRLLLTGPASLST